MDFLQELRFYRSSEAFKEEEICQRHLTAETENAASKRGSKSRRCRIERSQRRSFRDKRQAVNLVASSGRSIGSVAKELSLRDLVSALS